MFSSCLLIDVSSCLQNYCFIKNRHYFFCNLDMNFPLLHLSQLVFMKDDDVVVHAHFKCVVKVCMRTMLSIDLHYFAHFIDFMFLSRSQSCKSSIQVSTRFPPSVERSHSHVKSTG
jgi:hypothetical protein